MAEEAASKPYRALYLSPMIPSYDLKATSDFFADIFCFEKTTDTGNYIILERNNLTVHLLKAGEDIGQMEFYLEVDELDALWLSIKERVGELKTREPFDREYGMREFHIEVPFTKTLMFVGQVKT